MSRAPQASFVPGSRAQNPAPLASKPLTAQGQEAVSVLESLTAAIMNTFVTLIPSNYVAQTNGPLYMLQFQAIAEQLALIQLSMREVEVESLVDFTRPEFLWQMVGVFAFPDLTQTPTGIPEISGDLTFRQFLQNMLLLLLGGSTSETVQKGLRLLTDAQIEVVAKVDFSHLPTSAWGLPDQNSFEVNVFGKSAWTDPASGDLVEGDFGTGFPEDPFKLFRNNQRILRALKPASKLYDYRHVFKDAFNTFSDEVFLDSCAWHYEDFRKFCQGVKEIQSSNGVAKAGLFFDNSLVFSQVYAGSVLEVLSGPNAAPTQGGQDNQRLGKHVVVEVLRLPAGAEAVERSYTTSPSGLSGKAVVGSEGVLTDLAQDFSVVVEGELISILDGPNQGAYRIETLLGAFGGPPEKTGGGLVTSIRLGLGVLRLSSPVVFPATGQNYRLSLERLGVQRPKLVIGETVTSQFYL